MDTVVQISVYLILAMVIFVFGSYFLDLAAEESEDRDNHDDRDDRKSTESGNERNPEKRFTFIHRATRFIARHRKGIKAVILVLILLVILYETVLFRPATVRRYVLTPLYSFRLGFLEGNTYYIMEILLNVLLYVPFGFMLRANFKKTRLWKLVFISFLLSLCVELIQLRFCIGVFETDDIITNTLGGLIGSSCHILGEHLKRQAQRHSYRAH